MQFYRQVFSMNTYFVANLHNQSRKRYNELTQANKNFGSQGGDKANDVFLQTVVVQKQIELQENDSNYKKFILPYETPRTLPTKQGNISSEDLSLFRIVTTSC